MQNRFKLMAALTCALLASAVFAENAVGPGGPPVAGSAGQTNIQAAPQQTGAQTNQSQPNQQQQTNGNQAALPASNQGSSNANAPAPPNGNAQGQQNQSAALDENSKNLVRDLLIGTQMQVRLSEAAQQKSQNEAVKQFAQKLLNTTRPGLDKVREFANQHAVQTENDLSGKSKEVVDAAIAQQGPAFDQMYVKIISMQLDDLANKFQQQQGQAKDPAIEQLIQSGLPAIKQYQQQAQQLAQQAQIANNAQSGQAQGGAAQPSQASGGNLQSSPGQQQQSQGSQAQQANQPQNQSNAAQTNQAGSQNTGGNAAQSPNSGAAGSPPSPH